MSIRPFPSPGPADGDPRASARRHIHGLIGQTLAYFAEHATANLARVREHLLDLIDARPALARAQHMRSACILLHQQADVFNRAFQAALQISLEEALAALSPPVTSPGPRHDLPAVAHDGMSLSLVDVCEVERILLLDRVAQRFSAHHEASVNPLTLRLGALLALEAPSLASNPFRPEVLVGAFLLGWEKCGLDEQATEDLMLALEPQHSFDLATLYAGLNATLAQAGIEAQAAHRIKISDAPAGARAPHGPEPARAGSARATRALAGGSMAAHARQFLQRLGLGAPTAEQQARAAVPPAWRAADPQFMGFLGRLQAGASAASQRMLHRPGPLEHNVLRQMRERDEVRRAPELDRGTVDALAEVFDFVFADQAIPLQMKFVIGRLQIPVLKAAMIDRDFFLSSNHPARRLVDTLASASVAWVPEKGERDPLYLRIENTVKRVLTDFEDDLALFSELLLEFAEFLFETEQQAQARIEPAAHHERAGECYEQALAHADEVVHAHLKALPPELPLAPFLAPFLTSQWREVLARAWLQAQTGPAQWARAVTGMEQLIWSTQPKTHTQERRQLVALLPDLVRQLNTALDAINWTGEARATFTRRLISTHMMAIRMTQAALPDTASAVMEHSAGQQAIKALNQRRAGKLAGCADAFDAMAQGFVRGLWFDFMDDATTRQRCRLSWVSPMRTRLLFTNLDGFNAFVRSEREVAALLRHGRLQVIDVEPIVSRALDCIMSERELPQGEPSG